MKRVIDVVGAALGLVVLSPVMAVVALLVRVRLGSPVLFRQTRAGRHGAPFEMIKFRTMSAGVGSDDERLTALGRLLRSTSLDELPELVHVVHGQMSLVGPRPLLMSYLERYSDRQQRRHDVRPGLTGLAQVNGRNATTWEQRLEFDVQYVETRTLMLDMKILLRTVVQVVRGVGSTTDGGSTMDEFRVGAER